MFLLSFALLQVVPTDRGPSFAELAGGAAVVAVVALLTWGANSIAALIRRFDTFSQTLFGPPEAPGGLVRDVERLKAWRHDSSGHTAGIALYIGLDLEEAGKVRPPGADAEPPIERRFQRRRAADKGLHGDSGQ